jgi:hypothetical protein
MAFIVMLLAEELIAAPGVNEFKQKENISSVG